MAERLVRRVDDANAGGTGVEVRTVSAACVADPRHDEPHGFDLGRLVLLVGAGGGGIALRQAVQGEAAAGDVTTGGFLFSGHVELLAPIAHGLYVSAGVDALGALLPTRSRGDGGGDGWRMSPSYRLGLGLGYTL